MLELKGKNLIGKKKWLINNKTTLLSTYEGDSTFSSSSEYPVVISWTRSDNKTFTTSNLFIKSQYKEISGSTIIEHIKEIMKEIHMCIFFHGFILSLFDIGSFVFLVTSV